MNQIFLIYFTISKLIHYTFRQEGENMQEVSAITGTISGFFIYAGNHPAMIMVAVAGVTGYIICLAIAKLWKSVIRTRKNGRNPWILGSKHKKRDVNAEYFRYIANAQYRNRD